MGAGVGFAELIHLDYQRWVTEKTSIDVALTPLLVLNIVSVGASRHIPMVSSDTRAHNIVLSGNALVLVGMMDGSPALGVGGHVGYEWLLEHFGISASGGPLVLQTTGGPGRTELGASWRVTAWWVRR